MVEPLLSPKEIRNFWKELPLKSKDMQWSIDLKLGLWTYSKIIKYSTD
jgi:hypothetical protein